MRGTANRWWTRAEFSPRFTADIQFANYLGITQNDPSEGRDFCAAALDEIRHELPDSAAALWNLADTALQSKDSALPRLVEPADVQSSLLINLRDFRQAEHQEAACVLLAQVCRAKGPVLQRAFAAPALAAVFAIARRGAEHINYDDCAAIGACHVHSCTAAATWALAALFRQRRCADDGPWKASESVDAGEAADVLCALSAGTPALALAACVAVRELAKRVPASCLLRCVNACAAVLFRSEGQLRASAAFALWFLRDSELPSSPQLLAWLNTVATPALLKVDNNSASLAFVCSAVFSRSSARPFRAKAHVRKFCKVATALPDGYAFVACCSVLKQCISKNNFALPEMRFLLARLLRRLPACTDAFVMETLLVLINITLSQNDELMFRDDEKTGVDLKSVVAVLHAENSEDVRQLALYIICRLLVVSMKRTRSRQETANLFPWFFDIGAGPAVALGRSADRSSLTVGAMFLGMWYVYLHPHSPCEDEVLQVLARACTHTCGLNHHAKHAGFMGFGAVVERASDDYRAELMSVYRDVFQAAFLYVSGSLQGVDMTEGDRMVERTARVFLLKAELDIDARPMDVVSLFEPFVPSAPLPCSICLEEDAAPAAYLCCLHAFHQSCLARWLSARATCPVCATPVLQSFFETMSLFKSN